MTVAACDVASRDDLAAVIDAVPLSRPLCAVFHLAGVLDDGVATGLTPEQLRRALLPKLDGAWHLHELTRECPISTFVLFSSVAGVLGFQGQANYAAGNVFMDALAAERRRMGLPALSLAWGFWEQQGIGMGAHLGDAEIARMARQGIAPLPVKAGFALLDDAMGRDEVTLMPARLDLNSLSRALTDASAVPAMFRTLVQRAPRSVAPSAVSSGEANLRTRLSAMPEAERASTLLNVVREEIASVLGLAASEVSANVPMKSLGLDSLMAVDLRNRLSRRFDTTLPTTLAFDYPTLSAVAGLLGEKLSIQHTPKWNDADVREKLGRVSIAALRACGLLDALMAQPDDAERANEGRSYFAPKMDVNIAEVERDSLLAMMEDMLADDPG